MPTALHTPLDDKAAGKLGSSLYRKQILRTGSIDYKGQRLDFTPAYLAEIKRSFDEAAYDSVPFVMAPADNSHTSDPERVRGQVKGFELTADGLDALIEVGPDGAKVLDSHPKLGVSARIVNDLARADGRKWPAAVAHVLGTLDPRVTGMRPWQHIADLANDPTPTVDLTAATYTEREDPMPALTDEQQTKLARFLDTLSEDGAPPVVPTTDPAPKPEPGSALTDAQVAALVADLESDATTVTDSAPPTEAPIGASLSVEAQQAIDLANATAENTRNELTVLQGKLAAERFKTERAQLVNAGVPPASVELARPLLERPEHTTVDLANDQSLDVTAIVRNLLLAQRGTVDLSHSVGGVGMPIEDDSAADRQALIKAHNDRYGRL